MQRSQQEMSLLKRIVPEAEALEFPIVEHKSEEFGVELRYEIPDESKESVLNTLWPFFEIPSMDEPLLDIHENKLTTLRNCIVVRVGNRNIVVTENYFHSGGTCLDLIRGEGEVHTNIVRF